MTKRVVLIGHPVSHSLSGAMQQAAFDHAGLDVQYELWDRPPIQLADAIAEIRTDDFLGANVTIPHKERVVPQVDRLTEEAHATGAVNTLTKEGRSWSATTPTCRVQGRARQARRPPEDASPGGGAGRRRRCAGRRLRADPRRLPAGHRVQPASPSRRGAGQALRSERLAHGAAGDALARVDHRVGAREDQGADQRDVDRAATGDAPVPARSSRAT